MRDGQKQHITVSVGLATFDDDARTPQSMIEIADKGLYRAKMEGKNKVCYVEQK